LSALRSEVTFRSRFEQTLRYAATLALVTGVWGKKMTCFERLAALVAKAVQEIGDALLCTDKFGSKLGWVSKSSIDDCSP
jgi:hypothetical protein